MRTIRGVPRGPTPPPGHEGAPRGEGGRVEPQAGGSAAGAASMWSPPLPRGHGPDQRMAVVARHAACGRLLADIDRLERGTGTGSIGIRGAKRRRAECHRAKKCRAKRCRAKRRRAEKSRHPKSRRRNQRAESHGARNTRRPVNPSAAACRPRMTQRVPAGKSCAGGPIGAVLALTISRPVLPSHRRPVRGGVARIKPDATRRVNPRPLRPARPRRPDVAHLRFRGCANTVRSSEERKLSSRRAPSGVDAKESGNFTNDISRRLPARMRHAPGEGGETYKQHS